MRRFSEETLSKFAQALDVKWKERGLIPASVTVRSGGVSHRPLGYTSEGPQMGFRVVHPDNAPLENAARIPDSFQGCPVRIMSETAADEFDAQNVKNAGIQREMCFLNF